MNGISLKKILPHLIAIVVFIGLTLAFMSPETSGKKLVQSDISKHKGISKEIVDYREKTGEQILWTNGLFGGMPSFLVSVQYSNPVAKAIDTVLTLGMKGGRRMMFLYLIGFYILLMVMKVDPWLAIVGAIAFAFSSYHIIIIPAGHTAKARVIGYLPIILAGFILLFRERKFIAGLIVTTVATSMALLANHPQMLYYLFMIMMVLGAFYFYDSLKNKMLPGFFKALGLFIIGTLIAVGTSATRLMTISEYSKSSTRGGSELTSSGNESNKTSGLDRDYITGWSYGIMESFTLLVPNFYGGASKRIGDEKEAMNVISRENRESVGGSVSAYWGDQPFVAGPVYAGAGIFFLTLLGFWLLKGSQRYAYLAAILLMLMLSWGKNFSFLTDLFIDYFPAYNKFRSVNSMLIGVLLLMPFVGILGVNRLIKNKEEIQSNMLGFYIVSGISIVIPALMLITPSLFTDFFASGEHGRLLGQLESMKLPSSRIDKFLGDVVAVRKAIFTSDVTRSLMIVIAMVGSVLLFLKNIVKKEILIALLALVTLVDLWSVDRRYLTEKNFTDKRKVDVPYRISSAEKPILEDTELGFRVYNMSASLTSDARTSYFFRSLGGYHGAKMSRYQDFISRHFSQNINPKLLDMLNVKYITQGQGKNTKVQQNPNALGTSWFINDIKIVANADEEIDALTSLEPRTTTVIDKRYEGAVSKTNFDASPTDVIKMTDYFPSKLTYESNSTNGGFAVFSEIFYEPGWHAYIDDKPADHVRVNYILRGMEVPAGKHKIVFEFKPKSYETGQMISKVSSVLMVLIILGGLFLLFNNKKTSEVLPLDE